MSLINFTSFPILTTERLTLRQLSIDDQQNIFALRSDQEINKFLDRPVARSVEDAINFINKVNDNVAKNNSIYWAITLSNTGIFVGTICLYGFSEENSSCEIGYELLTNFQGQGIMKKAAEKVIQYAFNTLQFQKIIAVTHTDNQKSTGLMEKLNFIQSGEAIEANPDLKIYILTYLHTYILT